MAARLNMENKALTPEVIVVEQTVDDIKILSAWLHTDLVSMTKEERREYIATNIDQSTLDDLYDGLICETDNKEVSKYLLESYETRWGKLSVK